MNGELILTSYTFDQGRIALNDAFSGTAIFNILSANTFYNPSSLFSSSTGSNSIKVNNDSSNVASGNFSFVGGRNNSAGGVYSLVVGGLSNSTSNYASFVGGGSQNQSKGSFSSIVGGNQNTSYGSYSIVGGGKYNLAYGTFSFVGGGISNTATTNYSTVLGGSNNKTSGKYSSVLGGKTNTSTGIYSAVINGNNNIANGDMSIILGGHNTMTSSAAVGAVVIGMSAYTATTGYKTHMSTTYIDKFQDLNPQTTLPSPVIGRIFFSGTPLNRLMQNTGGTSSSWCII